MAVVRNGAALEGHEDGRTRCTWVAGHPRHYVFHDAEYGFIPDADDLTREKVVLAALMRDLPLVEVLDHRLAIWEATSGWDLEKLASLDDAGVDAIVARGGVLADRARVLRLREIAAACVATAKEYGDLREYFLAARFLPAEDQIAEICARFPGTTKQDAANLMEMLGTVEGCPHERDCWRA